MPGLTNHSHATDRFSALPSLSRSSRSLRTPGDQFIDFVRFSGLDWHNPVDPSPNEAIICGLVYRDTGGNPVPWVLLTPSSPMLGSLTLRVAAQLSAAGGRSRSLRNVCEGNLEGPMERTPRIRPSPGQTAIFNLSDNPYLPAMPRQRKAWVISFVAPQPTIALHRPYGRHRSYDRGLQGMGKSKLRNAIHCSSGPIRLAIAWRSAPKAWEARSYLK